MAEGMGELGHHLVDLTSLPPHTHIRRHAEATTKLYTIDCYHAVGTWIIFTSISRSQLGDVMAQAGVALLSLLHLGVRWASVAFTLVHLDSPFQRTAMLQAA